jgi:hypothetical protein
MIRRCDDGGSATAEFAVIVPAVVLLIALTAGSLSAVGRLVRLEQAVAQAARLAARGETGRVAELVAAIADARRCDRRGRRPRVRDGVRRPRVPLPLPELSARLRSRRRTMSMVSADTVDACAGEAA